MRLGSRTTRYAGLLAVGAFALHQLRYWIGYGEDAHTALVAQGHSYLPLALAVVAVLLVVGTAQLALALALPRRFARPCPALPSLWRRWLVASILLLSIYVLQEGLEGVLVDGHPDGLHGVFGHGGWVSLLLALSIGAVVMALSDVAERAIARAVARLSRAHRKRVPIRMPRLPTVVFDHSQLALKHAERAPPGRF